LQQLNPLTLTPAEIQKISPSAWAYLGDAVYELYIRNYYLIPPKQSHYYHQLVVAQVRAETQANHLHNLKSHLTSAELDILKRGRNAAFRKTTRLDPKVYQQASSLETLIGYLYLTDPQRLNQLLGYIELLESTKFC